MELSALIKKIGHSLVEIRVRALKSVLSKLDHSLISIHDVVQEKMLFVYLLEWFNFPEVPMSNEVLDLLLTLSKHPSSAQMLRDVGAVDFLTQLSPNVKPRQRAVIDGTLDQLFMLPDLLPSQTDENSSETGFFHKNTSSDQFVPIQRISANESVRCLKFSVFPWLTLTNTDRHILSSNESSLGSNNPNLVRTTCELLCDVIMQDFPAEIFLQRPNIAKKLLSLLKLSTGTGEGVAKYLHLAALSCLRQLCVELRKRLRFHQDPSFYSAKQDQFSQNSSFSCPQEVLGAQRSQSSSPGVEYSPRPSVVGRTGQRARGDGQDGDVASNSGSSQRLGAADRALTPADVATADLPDLGVENILELQFQQLTLAQFSVATVEHAIPILKTGLHVFQRALELLSDALLLLCESVSELVWDDHSLVGTEEKLRACLELLGDILCSHQSHSADISHIHQRMTYIGTAVFTLKLLQSVLPPEKASEHLPESTALAIFHLCLDSSLGSLLPSMQETAAAYLEQVNPDNHDLYRRVTRAALWMESTCNFIKEIQGEKNWLELLELADQSIDGLPFHQHLPVIQHCLNMCSYLWKFDQPSPLLQTESQKLLLKLLSHPLLPVRMETYKCTLRLVKDCLGIHNVSRQTQEVCAGVHFLLHRKLLYEIITFGLQDASEKVNVPAKDILLFLLQGRLMMTPSTWDRFTQALDPVMAVLQGYASTDDSLGNCVLLISDTSAEAKDDGFPRLAKLRASLRLLFSSQPRVRTAAVQQLVPQLKSSDTVSRPEVDQPVISSLSNIYLFIQKYITIPCVLLIFLLNHGQVESVEKLFSILQSDAVDLSLRRSAADQLAVSCDCLLEPSVCILRKLVYVDLALRHSLAQRDLLLLTLLRGAYTRRLIRQRRHTLCVAAPGLSLEYNLPFQAATHHAVSPHCSVLPPSSDLQTLGPARQALQVAWNTAWFCGTEKLLEHLDLKLSEAQVCSLKAVHLPTALQDCVQAIVRAAAHRSVAAVLSRLGLYLLIYRMVLPHTPTYSCKDVLQSLGWQAALTRFLQVRPACVEDEKLLVGIVAFLNAYFKHFYTELETDEEDGDLRWILELLLNQGLGEQEEQKNHISQRLQRELTGFFNTLLTCVTRTTDRMCLALGGPFKSQLAVRLLQSLRVSDAPRFYGLPSLERTLRGMVVLTAQPGWSSHCSDLEPSSLCSKYLSGLLEVISSFYVEWGENSLSFMGKGVTKNAIICLLHLSHEMMTVNKDKGEWSLGNEAAAEETNTSHLGLAWLVPLWVDRDPEVRFASLGLGAALSSISSGCQALCASCQNISGGLWGTLLNILLDQQESSLVRTEAAFILQNLVVMPMPANAEEAKNSHWQHPCVHDEVSGVSLVGLPALQALLYHCHYFQHMLLSASSCYRSWYGFHFQPGADVGTGPSPQGSSSLGTHAGLIDSCVEQMKQIYSQLNLMSLRPSKASQRKKVNWKSPISVAATDAHLTLALYALWPWLLLHDPTMEAALELLCVYTAHCTTACSALCGSGPAVVSGSKSSSTSSLMQSVMKLTSGFTVDYTPIHNLAFCLLTNLVQSRDCRGLLQKNNFLQAFLSVPMPKAAAVKAQSVGGGGGSLSAWLKLLLSVSLSEDGQQSILKVTGALELLVDLAPHRRHALLTLHNLCFNTANKSHLIANGTLWNIRVCVCVEFIPLTQGYERVKAGTCTPHQCV
uniref:Rotatin N-terminal domain-containing protein n=1 Tax=Gouania willdenowi TaxID=441366 RepID=A0A8C5GS52_GOUWI